MSDTVAAAAPLLAQQGLVELLELVKDPTASSSG
jgi:hypothetical protein